MAASDAHMPFSTITLSNHRFETLSSHAIGTTDGGHNWAGYECTSSSLLNYDRQDRKSTRLNSSHSQISYAVFCLKKKKINRVQILFSSKCSQRVILTILAAEILYLCT